MNGSELVAQNLANADHAAPLAPHQNVGATFEEGVAGGHHVEPKTLGLDATALVGLAMLVVIALMLWKKVPAVIGAALDKKIAGIRANLDEAAQLRRDAEALKTEYERKSAAAAQEADLILAHAREEAAGIVAQAESDATALIERRGRMAEDKIAAAERTAVAEVRAKVASAAAKAAATLIAERHGADADKSLVDRTIAGIGSARLN